MAVVADRRWHRKIDAHHTYRDLGNETLGRISIAREDRNRVALVMDVRVAPAGTHHGNLLEGYRAAWKRQARSAPRRHLFAGTDFEGESGRLLDGDGKLDGLRPGTNAA